MKTNEQIACNNFEKIGIIKGRKQMKEEVIHLVGELKFTGAFKGLDRETDMAYRKGYNNALEDLRKQIEGEGK